MLDLIIYMKPPTAQRGRPASLPAPSPTVGQRGPFRLMAEDMHKPVEP